MRYSFGVLALAALVSAAPAPVTNRADVIPNNYLVIYKPEVSSQKLKAQVASLKNYHISSGSTFKGPGKTFDMGDFKGFAGEFDQKTYKALLANPDVAYIEADQVVRHMAVVRQANPPWGLNRISHQNFAQPDSAKRVGEYVYDDAAQGEGVNVYVIDTGTYVDHNEFAVEGGGKRAFWDANTADSNNQDCNGHGTHCSGTVAGKTYGVAKKAQIHAVKVLDCGGSGTYAGVIAGIDWVGNNRDLTRGCVASMSLGGGFSQAVNDAVTSATNNKGCIFAIAAGNSNTDAKNTSPASCPDAITVGATDWQDNRASFSSYGSVLSVWAPGVDVLSSWRGGVDATNTISGTSMATPHVAGFIAYLLSTAEFKDRITGPNAVKVTDIKAWLKTNSILNVVKNPGAGSPNVLLNSGIWKSADGGEVPIDA